MIETMLRAITDAAAPVKSFTRYEYRPAFQTYYETYAPVFTAAVESREVSQIADELLEALQQYRKKLPFWKRGAAIAEQKMVMVAYLSPMLLRIPDPRCAHLAQTLREKWGALWPKDSYDVADFEKIVGGFRHSVMGIDLAGKHIGKPTDE